MPVYLDPLISTLLLAFTFLSFFFFLYCLFHVLSHPAFVILFLPAL